MLIYFPKLRDTPAARYFCRCVVLLNLSIDRVALPGFLEISARVRYGVPQAATVRRKKKRLRASALISFFLGPKPSERIPFLFFLPMYFIFIFYA